MDCIRYNQGVCRNCSYNKDGWCSKKNIYVKSGNFIKLSCKSHSEQEMIDKIKER